MPNFSVCSKIQGMNGICCIGHITLDKIVTPGAVNHLFGGTSFYFSNAISRMDVAYQLVTALADTEMPAVALLREKGLNVIALPSTHTVYFENIYPENQDHRTQRVLQKAAAFEIASLPALEANIFHLGPLLADDMSVELIQFLAGKGLVSLDVQGYLREVRDTNVYAVDWPEKIQALPYIHILKANETEMEVLTGESDVRAAAKKLAGWGVKEVVITLGSLGSVIYTNEQFYNVPVFALTGPVVDATGCGDSYMAGYLLQRYRGEGPQEAASFASALAALKIMTSGPFTGTESEVRTFMER